MPFLGLVWFTSCVSCWFQSDQTLLKSPDSLPVTLSVDSSSFVRELNVPATLAAQLKLGLAAWKTQSPSWLPFSEGPARSPHLSSWFSQLSTNPSNSWLNILAAGPGRFQDVALTQSVQLGQLAQRLSSPLIPTPQANGSFSNNVLPVLDPIVQLPEKIEADSNTLLPSASVVQTEWGQFQVWLRGRLIADVPDRVRAMLLAESLERFLDRSDLDASELQPAIAAGVAVGRWGEYILFAIDSDLQAQLNRDSQALAIEWVNNIRVALGTAPLSFADTQIALGGFVETPIQLNGMASWYGHYFHGRKTATGEIFNQNDFTAAHRTLPFHTYLKVTNLLNGRTAVVRINDRGPYIPGRNLDLSLGTARFLGSEETGVIPYNAVILQLGSDTVAPPVTRTTSADIRQQASS